MAFSKTRPRSEIEFVTAADAPPRVELERIKGDELDASGLSAETLEPVGRPWESFDPSDRPRHVFNLRLNDHDLAILRELAARNEDLSMQKIAARILVPELRRRVGLC